MDPEAPNPAFLDPVTARNPEASSNVARNQSELSSLYFSAL
jgi:hypothetical protein